MKRLGTVLLGAGALLGASVGVAMIAGVQLPGVSWLVAVGLAKLTLVASAGLMTAGAVSLRLARREEQRRLLGAPDESR